MLSRLPVRSFCWIALSAMLVSLWAGLAQAETRVACVGDSITYGATIKDRKHNAYPAHLGLLLGDDYQVGNFGVNGATLLKKANRPYWNLKAYSDALEFKPHVVVIMLGTNDSKPKNWKHSDDFVSDYTEFIKSFQSLPSKPRVILCIPAPAFVEKGIRGSVVQQEIAPAIRQLVLNNQCEIIDIHTTLIDDKKWMPDGVHPNDFGAAKIARRVYETVTLKIDTTYDVQQQLAQAQVSVAKKTFQFHGFTMTRFSVAGKQAIVAQPHVAAEGHPWVWRARFWGHQPQFDVAMLERGWHVAYIDVGAMFGAPKAVKRWDEFYATMVDQCQLSKKPILEGMSRGGLIIYNWAKANPTKVAGIYGDNPVCDARSWPGGKHGNFSARDWKACLAIYGISEEQALTFQGWPIDGLEPLAKAKVPLLNVIGLVDTIVPPKENSDVLQSRYEALGGTMEVIRKPGKNHHPHSLVNPQPIVDFALRATGRRINFAALAVPSVEYRGDSAGWGGGKVVNR